MKNEVAEKIAAYIIEGKVYEDYLESSVSPEGTAGVSTPNEEFYYQAVADAALDDIEDLLNFADLPEDVKEALKELGEFLSDALYVSTDTLGKGVIIY